MSRMDGVIDVEAAKALTRAGMSTRQIAAKLGASRSTVYRRVTEAAKNRMRTSVCAARADFGEDALPPGHPLSWGAISRDRWPGFGRDGA